MDLPTIERTATFEKDNLDKAILNKGKGHEETEAIHEVRERTRDKQSPYAKYAELMLASLKHDKWMEVHRVTTHNQSELIRVGDAGNGKYYFVAARMRKGDPDTGVRPSYSFVAFIGIEMEDWQYRGLPLEQRKAIAYIGPTLDGSTIYGMEIDEEPIGGHPEPSTVAEAKLQEEEFDSIEPDLKKTVALLRESLVNKKLNNLEGQTIPKGLLPEQVVLS